MSEVSQQQQQTQPNNRRSIGKRIAIVVGAAFGVVVLGTAGAAAIEHLGAPAVAWGSGIAAAVAGGGLAAYAAESLGREPLFEPIPVPSRELHRTDLGR